MRKIVGQRLIALTAAVAIAAVITAGAPGASRQAAPPDWAKPQIKTVVKHGLMARSVSGFHPNSALTRQALENLGFGLTQKLTPPPPPPPPPTTTGTTSTTDTGTTDAGTTDTTASTTTTAPAVSNPGGGATMTQLDRRLVGALGLQHAASEFAQGFRADGISVPSRFGTEVVARLLGLRYNHPAPQDYLELRPQDTATRAEAAYSAAQILGFGWLDDSWQISTVQSLADSFSLPQMNAWQARIVQFAVSKIGMPYVWGGVSDGSEVEFGVPARGGYDCSGFVWRVYKLQSYPNEGDLASRIQGRTTYVMSVEVPASKRIPFAKLQPADVLFFGSEGPHSSGAEIDHTAIYIGNGWFIQSSDQGVALAQLTGWYRKEFAWARRPLREAGLEP